MTLLKRHFMANGLTQAKVARKLKVAESTVSLWVSGEKLPSAEQIPPLAKLLKISAMQLTHILEPEPMVSAEAIAPMAAAVA